MLMHKHSHRVVGWLQSFGEYREGWIWRNSTIRNGTRHGVKKFYVEPGIYVRSVRDMVGGHRRRSRTTSSMLTRSRSCGTM